MAKYPEKTRIWSNPCISPTRDSNIPETGKNPCYLATLAFSIDKDHWLKLFIRKLTWPTVANILATLPPISPFLDYLSCPLVCVLLSTYCVRPTFPRPTVFRKNNTMNYFHTNTIIGGVVVIESSFRPRVTWFKS